MARLYQRICQGNFITTVYTRRSNTYLLRTNYDCGYSVDKVFYTLDDAMSYADAM